MTFLFKNKAIALFLLPFVVNATRVERKIYDLEASTNFVDHIELKWKRDPFNDGEIIEIQRSLHNANTYTFLMLSDSQKKNKTPHYSDNAGLKPRPISYDYRIGVFKNGKQVSDWSNIAVGSLVPVATNEDSMMQSVPCSAKLTLNNAVETSKGIFQLSFNHEHDCGKTHLVQVFLSKDGKTTDLALEIVQTQGDMTIVKTPENTKGYTHFILKIENQWDSLKF